MALLASGAGRVAGTRINSHTRAEASIDNSPRQCSKHTTKKLVHSFSCSSQEPATPGLPNGFLGRIPDDLDECVVAMKAMPRNYSEEPDTVRVTSKESPDSGSLSVAMARMVAKAQSHAQAADNAITMEKKRFNLASGCLVLINVVVIALETDLDKAMTNESAWLAVDALFLLAYAIEIGIRMRWERWGWMLRISNWVDVVVVLVGLIIFVVLNTVISRSSASGRSFSTFRFIKLARLVSLMKLVRAFKGLYVLLVATWQAMVTMSFLFVFAFVGFLIYSIFAVTLIGRNAALDDIVISGQYTAKESFGTILRSMYTLFSVMILEGWESISRPLVEEEPMLFLFIFSFICLFTFGMMNMIVAVVIEKTMASNMMLEEQLNEVKKEQMVHELESIKETITNAYCHEDIIRYQDFEAALRDYKAIGNFFSDMGFTLDEAKRLYEALDWDGNGDVTTAEFLEGIRKLQFPEYSVMNHLATHTMMRQTLRRLAEYKERVQYELQDFQIRSQAFEGWQETQISVLQEAEECLCEMFRRNRLTDTTLDDACLHDDQADTPAEQMPALPPELSRQTLFTEVIDSEMLLKNARSITPSPMPIGVGTPLKCERSKSYSMYDEQERWPTSEDVASRRWKQVRRLDLVMGALILVNVVVIAFETDIDNDEKPGVGWIVVDTFFVLIFTMEVAVRAYFQRWVWFQIKWNWFDVLCTMMAMIDAWILSRMEDVSGALSLAAVIRIFRLMRLVRLLKFIRIYSELYLVLMSLGQALKSMCNLLLVMFFGTLVYSIFTVQFIGRNSSLQHVRIMGTDTVDDRFGSVSRSVYSLFELMTLEGWDMVFRPILAEEPWLFLIVASFIIFFTFGLLNMIVAMVIQKTIYFREALSEKQMREERIRTLEDLCRAAASSTSLAKSLRRSGCLNGNDFQATLDRDTTIQTMFMDMGCSSQEALELFEVFDWDGKGNNTLESFCEGLLQLQISNSNLWHLLATQALSRSCERALQSLGRLLKKVFAEEELLHAEIDSRQSAQDEILIHLGHCLDHFAQVNGLCVAKPYTSTAVYQC